MMYAEQLARRIRLGEDSTLELKRVLLKGNKIKGPHRDGVADELAGMANRRGGRLVLGVDDKSRDVLGIPIDRLDAVEGWLRGICNELIKPPLEADINRIELPDADNNLQPVIEVVVPRGLFVHRSPGGYFSRFGSSKRELTPEALERLFQERRQSKLIRFDETPVPRTGPDDLNVDLARRFLREDTQLERIDLSKLGVIANDEDGVPRLTVSGALMCTATPTAWLPHAMIQAVC